MKLEGGAEKKKEVVSETCSKVAQSFLFDLALLLLPPPVEDHQSFTATAPTDMQSYVFVLDPSHLYARLV